MCYRVSEWCSSSLAGSAFLLTLLAEEGHWVHVSTVILVRTGFSVCNIAEHWGVCLIPWAALRPVGAVLQVVLHYSSVAGQGLRGDSSWWMHLGSGEGPWFPCPGVPVAESGDCCHWGSAEGGTANRAQVLALASSPPLQSGPPQSRSVQPKCVWVTIAARATWGWYEAPEMQGWLLFFHGCHFNTVSKRNACVSLVLGGLSRTNIFLLLSLW